ncbi:ABC transporter substrate-binding protein [Agrobacterium pusense]|jgi:NitT/TauT family transport system substrate-binding protein|uniref:ABC transporter substrate-binding protein n=1 Tax=Agrobacterium pusense TaxID=648995 RepID=UPI0037BFAB3B
MKTIKILFLSCSLCLWSLAAEAADRVSFMIDWLPAGDKAAIYYGIESGIFKENGLDVSVMIGRGASDVVTKLGTGSADVGSGGLAALLQAVATEKVPVKAVLPLYTIQPDAIFTTSGSQIDSIAKLVGKKVATATFSSSNVLWPLLLEANGLNRDAITLTKVDPGALAPMLATGRVDATISWITTAPAFEGPMRETGKTVRVLPWSDFGFEGYGMSVFASEAFISQRPRVLSRFVESYRKATEQAIANPVKAVAALKKMVPEIDETMAQKQWEASIPLMVNNISEANGFGVFNAPLLAKTWDWVARAQNIDPKSVDPQGIIADVD